MFLYKYLLFGAYLTFCSFTNNDVTERELHIYKKVEKAALVLKEKELNQDTAKMKSYQSFDEFSLCGVGTPSKTPYVNVKRNRDSIFVSSTDANDSVRLYVRKKNNMWFNHMEYDMHKKGLMAEKSETNRLARLYDRYIYNDTITEVNTVFINNVKHVNVFVKLRKKMFILDMDDIDSLIYINENNLRAYVFDRLHTKSKGIWEYELKESEQNYSYEGIGHKYNYSYPKKAYGFWGIQPGVQETYLYEGIDIREYANNLKSFQEKNPDFAYELVDKMPNFPGGYDLMDNFIKKNKNSLLKGGKMVSIKVIIEKDGSISNMVISKSAGPIYDEDALRIIKKMPKWRPGILNAKRVRCKTTILVSY